MNFISWIIFGFITAIIIDIIDPQSTKSGILGGIMLGVLGALLGGLLANLILGVSFTGFSLTSFIIATLGAALLLFISRIVKREERR